MENIIEARREQALAELQKVIIFSPGNKVQHFRTGAIETVDHVTIQKQDLMVTTVEGNKYLVEHLCKIST